MRMVLIILGVLAVSWRTDSDCVPVNFMVQIYDINTKEVTMDYIQHMDIMNHEDKQTFSGILLKCNHDQLKACVKKTHGTEKEQCVGITDACPVLFVTKDDDDMRLSCTEEIVNVSNEGSPESI